MFGVYKKVADADRASAWQMDSSGDEVKEEVPSVLATGSGPSTCTRRFLRQ